MKYPSTSGEKSAAPFTSSHTATAAKPDGTFKSFFYDQNNTALAVTESSAFELDSVICQRCAVEREEMEKRGTIHS